MKKDLLWYNKKFYNRKFCCFIRKLLEIFVNLWYNTSIKLDKNTEEESCIL